MGAKNDALTGTLVVTVGTFTGVVIGGLIVVGLIGTYAGTVATAGALVGSSVGALIGTASALGSHGAFIGLSASTSYVLLKHMAVQIWPSTFTCLLPHLLRKGTGMTY